MSQYSWDPNRSQYSCLDENLSVYSTSSKNRNQKYFARKPLQTAVPRVNVAKRKDRDSREFCGFYSPTHRTEALTLKQNIQKAIFSSPKHKTQTFEEQQSTQTSLGEEISPSIQNILSDKQLLNQPKKSFRKKKPQIEKILDYQPIVLPKQKQNLELSSKQIDELALQNSTLKEEIRVLKQQNHIFKIKLQQLAAGENIKEKIQQLEISLCHSKHHAGELIIEIGKLKEQQQNKIKAIDSLYNQSMKSLTEINTSLRGQIYSITGKLKYAEMEVIVLRNKITSQFRDQKVTQIVQQRNKLKKNNRSLRVEIISLRRKLQEQTLSELSLSRTNSELSLEAE